MTQTLKLRLTSSVVEFDSTVTDLGVVLDNQLSMQAHVAALPILLVSYPSAARSPAIVDEGCSTIPCTGFCPFPAGKGITPSDCNPEPF